MEQLRTQDWGKLFNLDLEAVCQENKSIRTSQRKLAKDYRKGMALLRREAKQAGMAIFHWSTAGRPKSFSS